ncbi:MAG: hypothetical protein JXN61_15285 [Sedimentisphaerales bacterium]|nr:hypothetical protein [Sedimentisphaerales bacterium]
MCKARFTIYAVLVLVLVFTASSYAGYSGGTGEPNSPYEIATVADWQELMNTPGDWDKHFVLTTDIDLNDVALSPVGNDANNFTGIFDGNDHIIRNADINTPDADYVGLFGYLGESQIRNLGVENISVLGDAYVGSLGGRSFGIIRNCYSSGSVIGAGDDVGGLVGLNFWIVSNCYSSSSVSGYECVGGLVGVNDRTGSISNCYSTGSVSGDSCVGGLVGDNDRGAISNCYSTASVGGTSYVGGLAAGNSGDIGSSFWDVNTSGWTTSAGGEDKTTSQMQDINTFLDSGWDFVSEYANGTCNYWQMPESGGYPVLATFCGYIPAEPHGSGTAEDPYIIADANELGSVWYRPSAHYMVAKDIDLFGISWSTAVVPFFGGVFDGNGCSIINAEVDIFGAGCVGLFGYLGTGGQIRNLGVEDICVFGTFSVGGLVGHTSGTITSCYSTGSVSGTGDYVGGLAGINGGIISDCYSTGRASGRYSVGGLVGRSVTTISNCYSTGEVSGTNFVGGLLGNSEARTGSTVSRSFWDVDTSGWTTSAGGEGKTTSQMQDINTFLEAGWDFVGETANGTSNFWIMLESRGYPVLATFCGYIPVEPRGSGIEADPYIIADANELGTVWYRPSAHYVMAKDIDLVGISWSTPLVPVFNGVFDGNGCSIRNADINMPLGNFVGLVAYLGQNGEITNLDVEGVSIFGRRIVGGLVGYSDYGTIRNCSLTGLISGKGDVGGLVGRNDECSSVSNSHSGASVSATNDYAAGGLVGRNWGAITNCYSTGSVAGGYHYVGGLLGYNAGAAANCYSTGHVNGRGAIGGLIGYNRYGAVSNCYSTSGVAGITSSIGGLVGCNYGGTISNGYSTGSVSGDYEVGGFLGVNSGTMAYCYSTGLVVGNSRVGGLVGAHYSGDIASSFWDVNISGWTTSDGGTPKTTEEMKNESTFVLAGWDFVGESVNGTEDIWVICEGTNYPRLIWQIPSADFACPDGVGLEDFGYFGGYWGMSESGAVNLDGKEGIGFGDLMVFCEEWLRGR